MNREASLVGRNVAIHGGALVLLHKR